MVSSIVSDQVVGEQFESLHREVKSDGFATSDSLKHAVVSSEVVQYPSFVGWWGCCVGVVVRQIEGRGIVDHVAVMMKEAWCSEHRVSVFC